MNYHNITTDDMLNGDGLRVVLWVSGCEHHCKGCQNPITWNPNGGLVYNREAWLELNEALQKDYIEGITFSGGDPLHPANRQQIMTIISCIKRMFPKKTVWVYTGYLWEEIVDGILTKGQLRNIDVIVDGKFIEELKDVTYHWAGSTNQRVIDVQESLRAGEVVLHKNPDIYDKDYHFDITTYNCGCDS